MKSPPQGCGVWEYVELSRQCGRWNFRESLKDAPTAWLVGNSNILWVSLKPIFWVAMFHYMLNQMSSSSSSTNSLD